MERKVIFNIEDRCSSFMYHWFIFMIAGLRHIESGEPTSGPDGAGSFSLNDHLYKDVVVTHPYNIYFCDSITNVLNLESNAYQRETLDLIDNRFKLVTKSEIDFTNDIVVNNYGEPVFYLDGDDIENEYVATLRDPNATEMNSKDGYLYLKKILEDKIDINQEDIYRYGGKIFYLSRKNSHMTTGNSGIVRKRQVVNEDELKRELEHKGVNFILLEDLSVVEKIKLFKLAKCIISPGSAGLVFSIFCEKNQQIIELNTQIVHQVSRQYYDICSKLDIPYQLVKCQNYDTNDNMIVSPSVLSDILEQKKLI